LFFAAPRRLADVATDLLAGYRKKLLAKAERDALAAAASARR
jgi:hypothetical protein